MHNYNIPALNKEVNFASKIEELTPNQYILFVNLLIQWKNNKINYSEFKSLLLLILLEIKIPRYYILKNTDYKNSINTNVVLLSETIDSFFINEEYEGKSQKVLNLNFIKNPVPKYKKLYGPADALQNLSFIEYIDAVSHSFAFITDNNEKHLNKLVAVLYRKKRIFYHLIKYLPDFDGQIRRKYNQNQIDFRLKSISKLSFEFRYGVFLWFRACDNYLKSAKVLSNNVEIDFSLLFKTSSTQKNDLGYVGVLFSLAETGLFGDVEKTSKQNLYDVLVRLYQTVNEQRIIDDLIKKR